MESLEIVDHPQVIHPVETSGKVVFDGVDEKTFTEWWSYWLAPVEAEA